jgi:hypothetical protein
MTVSEREELLLSVLRILSQRHGVEPVHPGCEAECIKSGTNYADLDEWMMSAWPADWPCQDLVELDNVGDPSAWLGNVFGEPISQVLFAWAWDDEANAASLADRYLREVHGQGYPLPSDFGDAPCVKGWTEEDEQQVRLEFAAFLRHWRECILQMLEEENSSGKHNIHDDICRLTLQELKQRVDDALEELRAREAHLIAKEVNERSITHHLAICMQKKFAAWNVDVEYNRNLGDIKRLRLEPPNTSAEDISAITVYPDIIIHRRGTQENLLVIEVKKAGRGDPGFDHRKLKAFTRPSPGGLGYRWGVHVVLPADLNEMPSKIWFENGIQI